MFSHYLLLGSRDSVVDVATRIRAARSRVQITTGKLSLLQNIQSSSRVHPPAIECMCGGGSQLGLEADHYLISSVEIINGWSCSPFLHTSS